MLELRDVKKSYNEPDGGTAADSRYSRISP